MKKTIAICLLLAAVLCFAGCQTQDGQVAYIDAAAAKAVALETAGLTADQAQVSCSDRMTKDGMDYYQVTLTVDGKTYQYQIDALTGVVIDSQLPGNTTSANASLPTGQGTTGEIVAAGGDDSVATADQMQSGDIISQEQAYSKALAHAGLTVDDVTFVQQELERDDGRLYYEIEFYTADRQEYDYEIDAYSGEVLAYDYDAEGYTASATGNTITAEDAKALALSQVPGADVSHIVEFETDYDDGRLEYEGTIIYEQVKYSFEIDGYSGGIRSWEVETMYR